MRAPVIATTLCLCVTSLSLGCVPSRVELRKQELASQPLPSDRDPKPTPGQPVRLPAELREDRFFVVPKTAEGLGLVLLTDTGGGGVLHRKAVERLKLPTIALEGEQGEQAEGAELPPFADDANIPGLPRGSMRLLIPPPEWGDPLPDADGLIGGAWFANRVWTFDYPGAALWFRAPGDVPDVAPAHRVPLGFKVDAQGQRETNFPRIQIQVDGAPLDLLFDTGASVHLTPAALAALADGRPADRATSFITASTFRAWQAKHPEWRVVPGADANTRGLPMIEVPLLEVAGYSIGPVWFTQRPDEAFRQWMSSMMDRPIEGALGGSALNYFRVTVDYPAAVAVFERVER